MMILLLDPSFTMTGYAVVDPKALKPVGAGAIATKKSQNKRVRVSEDDMERARFLARKLQAVITKYNIKGVCVEVPTGSQSAMAAKALGIAKGTVAAVIESNNLPCEYRTPQECKKAVTGRNNASKEEIEAGVRAFYKVKVAGNKPEREAQYDALAVGIACKDSDLFRLLAATN